MLAIFQRFFSISLILLASTWAAWCMSLGRPFWAALGAVSILLGHALFLAAEFAILAAVQTDDVSPHPSFSQLCYAWFNEVVTSSRVFLWRQPYRSQVEPDLLPAKPDGRRGVLLVHGFVCNRGLWNPWMHALRERDLPFVAINLEPIFGSIDCYIDLIEAAVSRVEASTGLPLVLVGHSMGGVAIRAWCAKFNADARVHRVITIGSPHQGTWLARFSYTPNGREMRLANPWLATLAAGETSERYRRYTCFFGHCDNIVFPASSATLPGAKNIHVPATAHVHLAFQPQVFAELCRWLR